MPIMVNKIEYRELALKTPLTLRMKISKDTIDGAKAYLGQTVGGKTVEGVKWGLIVDVCKTGEPDCETASTALAVYLWANRSAQRWELHVYFGEYYVTPLAKFITEAYKFGQEQDTTIDINLSDSNVSVYLNGKEYLATDTLKTFEQIRVLRSENIYHDSSLVEIPELQEFLSYNLQIIEQMDVTGLVNTILPIAIAVVVLSVIFAIFKEIPRR
jgi:hypothetical protein